MTSLRPAGRLPDEILPIGRALHRLGEPQQLLGVDESLDERDFLRARDFQTLPLLDDLDELRGFQQGFMGAGVKPCVAATRPPALILQPKPPAGCKAAKMLVLSTSWVDLSTGWKRQINVLATF